MKILYNIQCFHTISMSFAENERITGTGNGFSCTFAGIIIYIYVFGCIISMVIGFAAEFASCNGPSVALRA